MKKQLTINISAKFPKVRYFIVKYGLMLIVMLRIIKPDRAVKIAEKWLRNNMLMKIGEKGNWRKAF